MTRCLENLGVRGGAPDTARILDVRWVALSLDFEENVQNAGVAVFRESRIAAGKRADDADLTDAVNAG